MTTKRALSRLDTSPTTSDVDTCKRCGAAVTARKAIRLANQWSTRPVCCRCQAFSKPARGSTRGAKPALRRLGHILADDRPIPKPRVVIVRRDDPPAETSTGVRAKLKARNLLRWLEERE